MIQYGLNKEGICVTDYPQITPCIMGSFYCRNNSRMNRNPFQYLNNLVDCDSLRMHFSHHSIHEGVPGHGGKKAIEQLCKTQLVNNPIITITINDGFIEVENHQNSRHC
uniref:Uncharacterized protein n=1 Tax=Opuntia streptacantha TaxID=393608 RepID=A0A7C9D0Y4_OPUST